MKPIELFYFNHGHLQLECRYILNLSEEVVAVDAKGGLKLMTSQKPKILVTTNTLNFLYFIFPLFSLAQILLYISSFISCSNIMLYIFLYTGPEVDRLAYIAGKYKVHLVIGTVERQGFCLFSTVLYFDSLGRYLGKCSKLLPVASECAVWSCGEKSSLPVYDAAIGKVGGLLCWDNRMPHLRTELYAKGTSFHIYCLENTTLFIIQ